MDLQLDPCSEGVHVIIASLLTHSNILLITGRVA
jgi:hypothetical protein